MPDGQPQPMMGAKPGQPPFGSSPLTQPTQNQGYQAQGIAGLHMVVELLSRLIPMLGASSDAGQDALESLRKLAKHIPPGTVSPASQNNNLQALALRQQQARGMMQPPQAQQSPQPPMQAAA